MISSYLYVGWPGYCLCPQFSASEDRKRLLQSFRFDNEKDPLVKLIFGGEDGDEAVCLTNGERIFRSPNSCGLLRLNAQNLDRREVDGQYIHLLQRYSGSLHIIPVSLWRQPQSSTAALAVLLAVHGGLSPECHDRAICASPQGRDAQGFYKQTKNWESKTRVICQSEALRSTERH